MTDRMPAYDGSSLEWALWYLSLGLLPLPIRSDVEIDDFMRRWERDNPGATQEQYDDARRTAGKYPGGPDGLTWAGGVWARRGVSEAQAREWFEHYPHRRIYLLTGVGTGLSVLDVDTYKGGDVGPWLPLSNVVFRSLRGGYHLCWREREGLKTTNDKSEGLDTRGKGGGIAAPSGMSTPERTIERFAWPMLECPDAVVELSQRRRTPASPAPTVATPGRLLLHAGSGVDTFSSVVSTTRADGKKHDSAKLIVGMLCRSEPLPDDAVAASLKMLDDWLGTWPGGSLVRAGWEQVLRSSEPRSEAFVVEFVSLWNHLRCDPKWPDDGESKSARQIAASLWRTSTAAEQAARPAPAASLVLPAMPSSTVTPSPTTERPIIETTAIEVFPAEPSLRIEAGPDPYAEVRDWLRLYAPTAAQVYTAEDVDADATRELISCGVLPPWLGEDGFVDKSTPYGHGWGPWLDDFAGGGLGVPFMWVLVARRAKGGKTAFMDQHLTGLQMLGAVNLANGSGVIPQVWIVTEMPHRGLEQRGHARYIGVDQGVFRRGRKAELAPGIRELALRLREAPSATARRMFERTKAKIKSRDLWAQARDWRHYVHVPSLPDGARRGPALIDALRDIVGQGRRLLAHDLSRSEADILPIVVFDPIQRFGCKLKGSDEMPGDIMIEALREATDGEGWVTCLTSDTNQASAREGQTNTSKTPDAIVAQAIRGTYKVGHVPDLVLALDVLPLTVVERRMQRDERRELERQARIWVGLTRWAEGCDDPLPYRYFPRTGRFVAADPWPAPPPMQPPPPTSPPATPETGPAEVGPVAAAVAPEPVLRLTAPRRGRQSKA